MAEKAIALNFVNYKITLPCFHKGVLLISHGLYKKKISANLFKPYNYRIFYTIKLHVLAKCL